MRQHSMVVKYCSQNVSGRGNPYSRLHGVCAVARQTPNWLMLLNPFDKRLHLPAWTIVCSEFVRAEREIVGEKHCTPARLSASPHDAAQHGRVKSLNVKFGKRIGVVVPAADAYPVYGMRVATFKFHVALGTGNEKRAHLSNDNQTSKVDVATVEEIERAILETDQIQRVSTVHVAVANADKSRDINVQIERCTQFDGGSLRSKWRPCTCRETQPVSGGDTEWLSCVQVQSSRRASPVVGGIKRS